MKIFNHKSQDITVLTYNVLDGIYAFPFSPPTRIPAGHDGYIRAHDKGQCKLRVLDASNEEILKPGWVFSEGDNLSLENPKQRQVDDKPLHPGEKSAELEKFLHDNNESVFFVDGFGNELP